MPNTISQKKTFRFWVRKIEEDILPSEKNNLVWSIKSLIIHASIGLATLALLRFFPITPSKLFCGREILSKQYIKIEDEKYVQSFEMFKLVGMTENQVYKLLILKTVSIPKWAAGVMLKQMYWFTFHKCLNSFFPIHLYGFLPCYLYFQVLWTVLLLKWKSFQANLKYYSIIQSLWDQVPYKVSQCALICWANLPLV